MRRRGSTEAHMRSKCSEKIYRGHVHFRLPGLKVIAHLFGPVHAHEAMHLPGVHHLVLRGVPQLVVGLTLLQLLPAGQHSPGHRLAAMRCA